MYMYFIFSSWFLLLFLYDENNNIFELLLRDGRFSARFCKRVHTNLNARMKYKRYEKEKGNFLFFLKAKREVLWAAKF